MIRLALLFLATLVAVSSEPAAQDRLKFEKKRTEVLLDAGTRHYKLGMWARDRGLTTQAATEFVYALEISEGQHWGARSVLAIMRRYEDEFWKKRWKGTSKNRKSYEIKAAKEREKDAKELLDLADWAWRKKYEADALDIYVDLVRDSGEELVFDKKGRLVFEHGTVREEAAAVIREDAVEIDGKLYLPDEMLGGLAGVEGVKEVAGEAMRVRGSIDEERLTELQAMADALLPHLEEATQAKPGRRLDIFLFPTREEYNAWCNETGQSRMIAAAGFADVGSGTAVICAEDKTPGEIDALVLHELTHLYWYSVTPTAMPDWFAEGFAETYGGQGTFAWDGETLTVGGVMAEHRIAPLRAGEGLFDVQDLMAASAIDLWATAPERALIFYAQAWAWQRYLRTAAPEGVAEDFTRWIQMCSGSAAGSDSTRSRQRNPQVAADLFQKLFGSRLTELERGFREWLKTL